MLLHWWGRGGPLRGSVYTPILSLFVWRFILTENFLLSLTISYQKPFVFSVSVFWFQIFTLELNWPGLCNFYSKRCFGFFSKKISSNFLCLIIYVTRQKWEHFRKFEQTKFVESLPPVYLLIAFCIICSHFTMGENEHIRIKKNPKKQKQKQKTKTTTKKQKTKKKKKKKTTTTTKKQPPPPKKKQQENNNNKKTMTNMNGFVQRNLRQMVLKKKKKKKKKKKNKYFPKMLKVGYLVILLTALRFRFLYFSYSLSACRSLQLCSFYNIAKKSHKHARSEKEKYQRNDTPTCNKGSHCVTQQCS